MPQYPLGMGQQKTSSNALVMKTDKQGKVRYDEIVRQGHAKDRIVYSKYTDLLPKTIDDDDEELRKPSKEAIDEASVCIECVYKLVIGIFNSIFTSSLDY